MAIELILDFLGLIQPKSDMSFRELGCQSQSKWP